MENYCSSGKIVTFVKYILRIVVCLIHSDGAKEKEKMDHVAGEELPSLAKEVAQVESVRAYAGKFASFGVKTFCI